MEMEAIERPTVSMLKSSGDEGAFALAVFGICGLLSYTALS